MDPLCVVYDFSQMVCTLCQQGYTVDSITRVCEKKVTCLTRNQNGVCTSCFSGYQLDSRNSQCVKLPPNCIEMDIARGVCRRCSALTSFSSFGCIFPTTNCVAYNTFGRCQTCATGFV